MRIISYIDGFNLFFGALKAVTPKSQIPQAQYQQLKQNKHKLRWLNLYDLIKQFTKPQQNIIKINYYTAEIKPLYAGDLSPVRQQTYFSALATIPEINIVKGRFYQNAKKMFQYPMTNPPTTVTVLKSEEKGSDVNMASHMVYDACMDNFDLAVIITNDSDLLEPIKIIKALGKDFLILCPHSSYCHEFATNFGLANMRKITSSHLKKARFPSQINAHIQCPPKWL
jgi:uncharacterized LabA/DUF88 family protein